MGPRSFFVIFLFCNRRPAVGATGGCVDPLWPFRIVCEDGICGENLKMEIFGIGFSGRYPFFSSFFDRSR